MPENLLRATWAELDQADLRLVLQQRIGHPGQFDHDSNVLYLPSRQNCRVSLMFKDAKIIAIEPGMAFGRAEWNLICAEIEESILQGPQKIGRDVSFSTSRVEGWWRGAESGVQILPPPHDAPRAPNEMADHPFILEFPLQEASLRNVTNHRRIREHRRVTLLLNLLLEGATRFLPERAKHFWACVPLGEGTEIKWVQEFYIANIGQGVANELSSPIGEKLEEVETDGYYTTPNFGSALRVPNDLDQSICRYQNLSPTLRAKFDRATYWMGMASRQWGDSMSASFASLVSSAEALTEKMTKHYYHCTTCQKKVSHDVPGSTENFRGLFEKYVPEPGLQKHRSKMYTLRSKISHGGDLMQLDQNRAFGWDPPWWNEQELHRELWSLLRIAARNWLKDPPTE